MIRRPPRSPLFPSPPLSRSQNAALRDAPADKASAPFGYPSARDAVEPGWANKSIALKLCRNVTIRDITILHGGRFALLAPDVYNPPNGNFRAYTKRDSIYLDCCR